MSKPKPSLKTLKQVYERWKGMCAFCGDDITVEQHHIIDNIVAIKTDPSLIDDPDKLILLCSKHHTLTQKKKPNDQYCISFIDIEDLKRSKYATAQKSGFYFNIPQNFQVSLGSNLCSGYPYILMVNNKPLIEMWPQQPVYYVNELRFYLYMRFFDEKIILLEACLLIIGLRLLMKTGTLNFQKTR